MRRPTTHGWNQGRTLGKGSPGLVQDAPGRRLGPNGHKPVQDEPVQDEQGMHGVDRNRMHGVD